LTKFREMVSAQGGDLDRLPGPGERHEIVAERGGYLAAIDTEKLGLAIIELGGGRKVMTDKIDPSVGLEMLVRIGDRVEAKQPIVRVFASRVKFEGVRDAVHSCFRFSDQPVAALPLIVERVE
jgi:thymidine phosphorylase